ncbi:MAG: hypothetical protein CSB55_01520 [Candidatus Cloacimonadota bacterium]|nr:MAG: hypothetical protein CSB55_01520 [Candidatus Cloacimonadota bacterium]
MLKLIGSLLFATAVFSVSAGNISFYCDEYPPFNYSESRYVAGVAVDWLEGIFEIIDEDYKIDDIELVPWNRGYNLILDKPNTCMFSVTKTKEREDKFLWVGPIAETTIVLISKKNREVDIKKDGDYKKYRISAIKNDISEIALLEKGIKAENIDYSSNHEESLFKLQKGRIDFCACEKSVASFELFNNGNLSDYICADTIKTGEIYFAFNKQTPKSAVKKFQDALDKLKKKNYKGLNDFPGFPFLKCR